MLKMPDQTLRASLREIMGDRVFFDYPIERLTTMGVGGPAWALARPETADELADLLAARSAAQKPFMVIGRGSNLLFPDEGFDGLLIKMGGAFKSLEVSESGLVKARAAVKAGNLVSAGLNTSFEGFECLGGIPCSVGGALTMNAGSGGGAIGDVLTRIFYMEADGQIGCKTKDELDIAYRRLGGLPEGAVIVEAEFQLRPVPAGTMKKRLDEMSAKRKSSQPQGVRSAGCFFKNPAGDSAGRLIDQCGLKGLSIGGAMVSEVHANFLINTGTATAQDFLALRDRITEEVEKKFGLVLETEVQIIGRKEENIYA
jgi:UDP-N-acetylmuramate dehydrogenase